MRWLVALAAAIAAVWFGFVYNGWLDPRPVQRLLFLGHSYTYYNDMPAMVAKIADSADSPVRYDITMSAFPNATMEGHWNHRKTRRLLDEGGWYRVVAQPEGGLRPMDADSPMFVYAGKLLRGRAEQPPALIVNWQASDAFVEKHYSMTRFDAAAVERGNFHRLAITVGADLFDVGRVWDKAEAGGLPFSLYKDGNHPSLEGTYLVALVVYAGLSYSDVTHVTYVPWGMKGDDAALLRERVQMALTSDD